MKIYYYLINGAVFKGAKKPKLENEMKDQKSFIEYWLKSLIPCDISKDELGKVLIECVNITGKMEFSNDKIDITDIVECEFLCGLGECIAEDGCCISCMNPKYNIKFKKPKKRKLYLYTEDDMGLLWQYILDKAKQIVIGAEVTNNLDFDGYIKSLKK